jgi:hypothetical protein
MLTTLETTYLFIAIFLPVIVAVFFWQVWRPGLIAVAAIGVVLVGCVFILPGKAQPAINPTEDITITRSGFPTPKLTFKTNEKLVMLFFMVYMLLWLYPRP